MVVNCYEFTTAAAYSVGTLVAAMSVLTTVAGCNTVCRRGGTYIMHMTLDLHYSCPPSDNPLNLRLGLWGAAEGVLGHCDHIADIALWL